MIQKLMVILLSGTMCLGLVGTTSVLAQSQYNTLQEYEKTTGERIEKFNEARMLKVKVAAGELLPVEKRLPIEPLVIEPLQEIGEYGGTIRGITNNVGFVGGLVHFRTETLLKLAPNYSDIEVNILKDYSLSQDAKTLTLFLRKGMKWSDGASFTADDFLFWYDDVFMNKELTPIKSVDWIAGDEPMNMEKVDDYTVRLHFAVPYPTIVPLLAINIKSREGGLFLPKHYLKKYHMKHNQNANELAKKEGFDSWWQAFNFHYTNWLWNPQDPNFPIVSAWMLLENTPTMKTFVRNPYYWKVDTAGNQLPYIDKLAVIVVATSEMIPGKIVTGEVDHEGIFILPEDYPFLKKNEKKGHYRVLLWQGDDYTHIGFSFNETVKDPIKRRIFQDVRFRRAMSLAIDREEINDLIFLGLAKPGQCAPFLSFSYYKEGWNELYASHDPDESNRLLDEMGLNKRDKDGHRLGPDGNVLTIVIDVQGDTQGPFARTAELVKSYWDAVGVKTILKVELGSIYEVRKEANEMEVGVWAYGGSEASTYAWPESLALDPTVLPIAREWVRWFRTNGEEGEEPPIEVKNYYKLVEEWQGTTIFSKEYKQLAQKVWDSFIEHLWIIGTVKKQKYVVVVNEKLQNVPTESWNGFQGCFNKISLPESWFFTK